MSISARLRRTATPVVVVGAAMLLLSGCLRYEYDVSIDDKGRADLAILVDVQNAALGSRPALDELLERGCAGLSERRTIRTTEERIEGESSTGFRCTAENVTIEQLVTYLNSLNQGASEWTISQGDGKTILAATVRLDEEAAADGGADGITTAIRFAAPGKLSADNNATSVDGSTATWELAGIDLAEGADLTAEWNDGGGSNLLLYGLLGAAGLLIVVGLVLLLTRGRNRGGAGPSAPPGFAAPGGFPPAGGPAAPPWAPATPPAPPAAPQGAPPAWSAPPVAPPPAPPVAPPPAPPVAPPPAPPVAPPPAPPVAPPPAPPVAPPPAPPVAPPPAPPVAPPPAPPAGGQGTVFAPPPDPPRQ